MASYTPGEVTGSTLVESDRVEGTAVYDPNGETIGTIKRLMIDKLSGKVAYAVLEFGGFFGMAEQTHQLPWSKLTYDTSLGGFRIDLTEKQLKEAPDFYRREDYHWSDRADERRLHDYWQAPYYWG